MAGFCTASGQQAKPQFVIESKRTFPPGTTFPGAEWEKVTSPEAAGYSSEKLEVLRAWLKTQNTTGMLVAVGGRVLLEYGDAKQVSKIASVRKSILGMLYGNYVVTGKIDLHKTVKELGLDDVGKLLPFEERATLQDLLTARSGIYLDTDREAPRRGSQVPGVNFYYQNWDFNAAGAAFEKLTGKNIYDALETDLARPIGMQDFDRAKQKKEPGERGGQISEHPEYAMYLSTRDMARIGMLMLRAGQWKDQQVLPKNWTDYLTTLVTPVKQMPPDTRLWPSSGPCRWGYGAMWWVWDASDAPLLFSSATWSYFNGSFTAQGTDGQYITVLPMFDMVVAHKNARIDQNPDVNVPLFEYQTMLQMLMAARCEGACK